MPETLVMPHSGSQITVSQAPHVCPICHRSMTVVPRGSRHAGASSERLQVWFACPDKACQSTFIAEYLNPGALKVSGNVWLFQTIAPQSPPPLLVPEGVAAVSPTYVRIRTQALQAETTGLDEIAGTGYRKALKFLIKDYLIHKRPADAESIKAAKLMQAIKNYIPSGNLRTCAERTTWLGNDETHYTRVWTDRDIQDLKNLLNLTQAWVDQELQTEAYERGMPKGTA